MRNNCEEEDERQRKPKDYKIRRRNMTNRKNRKTEGEKNSLKEKTKIRKT